MKTKVSNIKFSNNFFKALICPIVAIVMAVVFLFVFGFNKDIDLKGGIVVSVVAGIDVNLSDAETYNTFKQRVDEVLETNNLSGRVYTVEVNDMQEYTLVVKVENNHSQDETTELISTLKTNLISEFYADANQEDVTNNNLVLVAEFGSCLDNTVVLTTILATIVAVVVMGVYIALRMGLDVAMLSLVLAIFNNIFALSLIMVARVPLTYSSIFVVPFVALLSVVASCLYLKKAKDTLKTTNKYDRLSNFDLADDVSQSSFKNQVLAFAVLGGAMLLLGLVNICNSVLFMSLALFTATMCVLYSNVLLLPWLFAKTFVRKVKRAKASKKQVEENRLTEEQIMKETDLNNLVSN